MTPAPRPPLYSFANIAAAALAFSPKGDCERLVVDAIDRAHDTLHVQAYEFSSHPICDAVVRAHQRGVGVIVLLDKANKVNPLSKWFNPVGRASLLPQLRAAGVTVLFDSSPKVAHNKLVIVDGELACTGSFNFSAAAQFSNAENLLAIHDVAVARAYETNFAWRLSLSKP